MNEREKTIRLWFDMWLNQQDMGIDDIFTEDVIYTESWSPQYNNRKTVKHWFQEWNTRGKVVIWEIKQFFHKGDQTVVEWYFKNEMNNGDKDKKLMNPFATILFCEKCGAVMKRNVPAKTQNTSPWYRCPTRGCNCRTIKCDFLEAEVVKAMSQWWGEYTIKIKEDKVAQTDSTETALSIVREQLTELQLQQDKICEYLEKGIYTIEMFTKRNDTLTREIHKVQAAENELLKKQGRYS